MARPGLIERLEQGVFVLDGAMGTQLIAAGVAPGGCNEALNLDAPEQIVAVHTRYLQAGSDAVLTNTFGGNAYSLRRHGRGGQVREINRAAAELARRAAGPDRYVLGDVGPTGDFLKPLGSLDPDDLRAAFAEQVRGLCDGGVDGILIETMTAVDEAVAAVEAARSVTSLPVFASFAFDPAGSGFRTMMGVDPAGAWAALAGRGLTGVGFNCGTLAMEQYVALARAWVEAAADAEGLFLLAEPNAGRPDLEDGQAVYRLSPEDFAAAVARIHQAGVRIVGGCCGTGPEHIAALSRTIRS